MAADDISLITDGLKPDLTAGQSSGQLKERHARIQSGSRRRIRVLPPEKLRPDAETVSSSVLDAAAFLVQVPIPMSWLKIQDLLYFGQAWHLVWDGELLFPEPIVAVEDGIRIPVLDELLHGKFEVTPRDVRKGRDTRLTESARRTLSGMVKFYGQRSHFRLSEALIQEEPWRRARSNPPDFVIDPAVLHRHYRNQH